MTRPLIAMLASVSALGPAFPAMGQALPPPAPVEVVIEGKGFGHGVGMAQDGAYAMGLAGASAKEILAMFYPGATLAKRSATVRVEVLDGPTSSVIIGFPSGGEVREGGGDPSPGFPVTVKAGGRVRLSFDGRRYTVSPLEGATPAAPPAPVARTAESPPESTTTTTIPSLLGLIPLPPVTTVPPNPPVTEPPPPPPPVVSEPVSDRAVWAIPRDGSPTALPELGRRYKGRLETGGAGGGFQLVNHLDLEQYVRGIAEVPPSWPAAALQAQAIAARTYAVETMAAGRTLCSSQQCQVYLGETAEHAATNGAAADTAGQVLMFGGSLAQAVYSASGGGVTATPEEGFGQTNSHPYLKATPYPTIDPQPWVVRMSLADVAARSGYRGRPSDIRVSRVGPSGRPLEIVVSGDAGDYATDGLRFVANLGLRSTLFTIRTEGPVETVAAEATPSVAPQLGAPSIPKVFQADTVEGLGRAPWAALAMLLLAAWAVATRARFSPRRPTSPSPKAQPGH